MLLRWQYYPKHSTVSTQSLSVFQQPFLQKWKNWFQIYTELQGTFNSKTILKKKNKIGGLTLSGFQNWLQTFRSQNSGNGALLPGCSVLNCFPLPHPSMIFCFTQDPELWNWPTMDWTPEIFWILASPTLRGVASVKVFHIVSSRGRRQKSKRGRERTSTCISTAVLLSCWWGPFALIFSY